MVHQGVFAALRVRPPHARRAAESRLTPSPPPLLVRLQATDQGGAGFTLSAPFRANYPFGHGLDYLSVTYGASSAVVDAANLFVNVSVALSNAAPVAGLYVVQVYFAQALSRYARFQRMLAGFAKVAVPAGPGGAAQASISVPYADLAHWDPVGQTM